MSESNAFCGARTQSGGECRNRAGARTEHPGFGRCWKHSGASPNGSKAAAKMQVMAMASEAEAEPHEVLLKTIRVAWGSVVWLQERVANMDPEQEGNAKMFVAYQQLYGEWTERAARFSKMALDAGVAERQVQLAEGQAALIAQVVRTILDGLALTPAQQQKAPQLVRGALLALEA